MVVDYRRRQREEPGHLPHTMPQKSCQDSKRLLPPILQTFYPVAFWQALPKHSVSYPETGEQLLPQGHQAAKWTLILHCCTRHLHALSLSLSYYCLYLHLHTVSCTTNTYSSELLHY